MGTWVAVVILGQWSSLEIATTGIIFPNFALSNETLSAATGMAWRKVPGSQDRQANATAQRSQLLILTGTHLRWGGGEGAYFFA